MGAKAGATLLQLPDPCLVAVLQYCADDLHSLFSAARAHSRLHQAAVLALSSITVSTATQEQLDALMLYLAKYGQHLHDLDVTYVAVKNSVKSSRLYLRQLPPNLQLDSLNLSDISLQLLPGCFPWHAPEPAQGMLQQGVPRKQLRLHDCTLIDEGHILAAALSLLPGLQHLSISYTPKLRFRMVLPRFPTAVLSGLQQLTFLELLLNLEGPDQQQPALQPLQALTRLADLRLAPLDSTNPVNMLLDSSMLSGLQHLTRLDVSSGVEFEPGALAGQTQLQHLVLTHCLVDTAQVLLQLPQLQQLTHLGVKGSLSGVQEGGPPAEAFSALTAGSKLQYLDLSFCKLPAAAWHHVFDAAQQLPHLRSINTQSRYAAAPEGSRLLSCCPGLQPLDMQFPDYSAEPLAQPQRLSALHTLRLVVINSHEGLAIVSQLTGLRELTLHAYASGSAEELLPQLAQLKQLTALHYSGVLNSGKPQFLRAKHTAPGDEPIWQQVLRLHDSNPAGEQAAATALEEQ